MNYLNNFFICSKNSLRKQTEAEIKKQQPMLFPTKKEWIYNSITLEYTIGWIVIGLFICILLSIAGSYFGFIPVDINSAKSMIDQRIGNLATIIGTSLTVATLLINNVANKKKEYYEIMFKRTYLRGTVITTLMIFSFLLSISFLKDFLISNYPNFYCNLYGFSYILIFFVLWLIGRLFYNLIHIFDPLFLQTGIKVELGKATKKEILDVLFAKKSIEFYEQSIKRAFEEEEITPYLDFNESKNLNLIPIIKYNNITDILDVKIKTLTTFISKNKQEINEYEKFDVFCAFQRLNYSNNFLFNKTSILFKILKKSFFKKKSRNETLNFNNLYAIVKSDFNRIAKASAKDLNETELENIISNYEIIYNTYYDCILKFQENHDQFEAIKYIHYDFQIALEDAFKNDNKQLIKKIMSYGSIQTSRSIYKHSFQSFHSFLRIEDRIISASKTSKGNYTNLIINRKIESLASLRRAIETVYKLDKAQESHKYIEQFFYHWSEFLYDLIENKNYEGFKKAIKDFDKAFYSYKDFQSFELFSIIEKIKRKESNFEEIQNYNQINYFNFLYLCSYLAIYSWICQKLLISNAEDEVKELKTILNSIRIPYTVEENIIVAIEFVYTEKSNDSWSFIRDWGYNRDPDTHFVIRGISVEWLLLGFIVYSIRSNNDYIKSVNIYPTNFMIVDWENSLNENFSQLLNDFEKWKDVLNFEKIEDFEARKNDLLEFFRLLRFKKDRQNEKEVETYQVPNDLIEKFKEEVLLAWKDKSSFLYFIEKFGNVETFSNIHQKNNRGLNQYLTKERFKIEQENFGGTESAKNLAYKLNEQISNVILSKKSLKKGTLIINAINESILSLEENKTKPNLIIIGAYIIYDRDKYEEDKFLSDYFDEINQNKEEKDFLGIYKGIPVYRDYLIRDTIIVCNFNGAFELQMTEREDWLGKQLHFSLEEINDEKAKQIFFNKPDSGKEVNSGQELSEEEAIIKIKNNLHFKLFYSAKFNIRNYDAYELISFS